MRIPHGLQNCLRTDVHHRSNAGVTQQLRLDLHVKHQTLAVESNARDETYANRVPNPAILRAGTDGNGDGHGVAGFLYTRHRGTPQMQRKLRVSADILHTLEIAM